LAQLPACRADIERHCQKTVEQLPKGEVLSDMLALEVSSFSSF
jgi:hypothetical protein